MKHIMKNLKLFEEFVNESANDFVYDQITSNLSEPQAEKACDILGIEYDLGEACDMLTALNKEDFDEMMKDTTVKKELEDLLHVKEGRGPQGYFPPMGADPYKEASEH